MRHPTGFLFAFCVMAAALLPQANAQSEIIETLEVAPTVVLPAVTTPDAPFANTAPLGDSCLEFSAYQIQDGPIGRWFSPGRGTKLPTHIVIHTTESKREAGGEQAVAGWLSRTSYKASTHFVVGPYETLRTVDLDDTAWGVGSAANTTTIQIELTGEASTERSEWLNETGSQQLCRAAALTAALAVTYDIPVRRVEAPGLLAGAAGVAGHYAFTLAFGGSTHTDPGPGFPWDVYLAQSAIFAEQARLTAPLAGDVLKPDLPAGVTDNPNAWSEGVLDDIEALQAAMAEVEAVFERLN